MCVPLDLELTHCAMQQALRGVQRGQPAAKTAAGLIAAAWLAANIAYLNSERLGGLPMWQTLLSAASVSILLALSSYMHVLERRLTYTDYIHADH